MNYLNSWVNKFRSFRLQRNYLKFLKISGYKDILIYKNSSVNENDKNKKKKRKRNTIWYNPDHTQLM